MTKEGVEKVEAVKKRINAFLLDNDYARLNPVRDNEYFIMRMAVVLDGACPCDTKRPQCPCEHAAKEITTKGHCLCALFVHKKYDYYQGAWVADEVRESE